MILISEKHGMTQHFFRAVQVACAIGFGAMVASSIVDDMIEKEMLGNAVVLSKISDAILVHEDVIRGQDREAAKRSEQTLAQLKTCQQDWQMYQEALTRHENLSLYFRMTRALPRPPTPTSF